MKMPPTSADRQNPGAPEIPSERDARRAAALRANLARRKVQARGRAESDEADAGDGADG